MTKSEALRLAHLPADTRKVSITALGDRIWHLPEAERLAIRCTLHKARLITAVFQNRKKQDNE